MASGNVTHNLRHAFSSRSPELAPWAREFDLAVTGALKQRDDAALCGLLATDNGRLAHPTPEHYLPLLYAYGASRPSDAVSYPVAGFSFGSLSMRSVRFG